MEKVVLRRAVLENPKLIFEISNIFGSQAVTACIDVIEIKGDEATLMVDSFNNVKTVSIKSFSSRLNDSGIGEIVIQSVMNDSMLCGYNLEHISAFSSELSAPVVALGGCSSIADMENAVKFGATAVAAGTMFTFLGSKRAVLINYPSEQNLSEKLR
jgi:imidazole glycerol-phosphate synthase subunit HisF